MSVVTRVPGYHTLPHRHDNEQINYIADGDFWFFVEDKAYHCKTGDFQRVPRNVVHWAWNRSDRTANVIEIHTPGGSMPVDPNTPSRIEGPFAIRPPRGLFDDGEVPNLRVEDLPKESRVPYDQEVAEDSEALTTGLYIAADQLPSVKNARRGIDGGLPEIRGVYGTEGSLATAKWPAGYHSQPYAQDAETLIHFLAGEIWFFVGEKAFHCEQGDFLRIPRNVVHWQWNRSNQTAHAIVESSPPVLDVAKAQLVSGPTPEGWVALFDSAESPTMLAPAQSHSVSHDAARSEARLGLR
jgi:quercetin dioxygenase-like cupin family protein